MLVFKILSLSLINGDDIDIVVVVEDVYTVEFYNIVVYTISFYLSPR